MRLSEFEGAERENSHPEPKSSLLGEIRLNKTLASQHRQLTIEGTPVLFPCDPYPIQVNYMKEVIKSLNQRENALLQSPTGTGKTLSLLCSTLAWLRKHREEHPNEDPPTRIIYLSRTHQQLKQVIRQLKKTAYQPRVVVTASRDHACCNQELRGLSGPLKELECRKRIGGVEGKNCSYSRIEQTYMAMAPKVSQRIMDLQDLVQYGQQNMMCPFYYGRRVKEAMDVVFMPYNYLLDRHVSTLFNISCKNAILVFDEAHNVASVSEECNTLEMSTSVLATAIEQLSSLKEAMLRSAKGLKSKSKLQLQTISAYNDTVTKDPEQAEFKSNISSVESFLQPIAHLVKYFTENVHEFFRNNQEMEESVLIDFRKFYGILLKGMEPSKPMMDFAAYCDKSTTILADMLYLPNWAIDRWTHFFKEMHTVTNANYSDKYTVAMKMDGSQLHIKVICLDPSRSFSFLREMEPRGIILTSGTLSPMKSWESQLQVKFPRPICCPHIIKKEQVFAAGISNGPKNQPLCFSFKDRDKAEMYKALGEVLIELVKSIPNGMIVLFTSYGLMDTSCQQFRTYSQLGQFYRYKDVFIEERNSVSFKEQLGNFTKASRSSKGALLFAVMRGKIAEGIDLSEDECRAIVIVGVPFPNLKDKRIQAKKLFLDANKGSLSGRDWYMAETYRAINQAMGRVIRGVSDYGAVYLIDERFQKPEVKQQLSDWVASRLETYYDIGRLGLDTRKFFEGCKKAQKQSQQSKMSQETNTPRGVEPVKPPPEAMNEEKSGEGRPQPTKPKEEFQFKSYSLGRKANISGPTKKPLPVPEATNTKTPKIESTEVPNNKPRNDLLKQFLNEMKNEQLSRASAPIAQQNNHRQVRPVTGRLLKETTPIKPALIETKATPTETDRSNYKVDHFQTSPNEQESECPICKVNKKLIRNKACRHSLCLLCWQTWLQTKLSCPICRERVRRPYLMAD